MEENPVADKSGCRQLEPHQRSQKHAANPRRAGPIHDRNVFREVLNGLNVGVATASRQGMILYANSRFAEMLGCPAHREIAGSNLRRFLVASSRKALGTALEQALHQPASGEMKVETVASKPRTIQLCLSPMQKTEGAEIRIVATDVTELVKTGEHLKKTEELLNSLSGQMFGLQDAERRRIARDLHDVTGQELAVVMMWLTRQANRLKKPGSKLRKAIRDSVKLLQKVQEDIRTLSYVLHPPFLDEFGLTSALDWYVQGFNKRSRLEVSLDIPSEVKRFGVEKETSLFRMVQESLMNVLLHSHSPRARIQVLGLADCVQVRVEDEGKGVPQDVLAKLKNGKGVLGVGLAGMRERLRQLGGTLEVHSGPRGTRVVGTVPLTRNLDDKNLCKPLEEKVKPRPASRAFGIWARTRILVVDDHEVVRKGIKALLADQPDLEICGEARNGFEALARTKELNPDIIIMDLTMPRTGGLLAANQIRQSGSKAKILILSTHEFEGLRRIIEESGCAGMVPKAVAHRELIHGVRAVLGGARFFRASF